MTMRRHQWIVKCMSVLLAALLLSGCAGEEIGSAPDQLADAAPKTALMVIYDRFEETEYGLTRQELENAGVVVYVAASSLEAVQGHQGTEVLPDLLISEAHGGDYDAVIFVGGYAYDMEDEEAIRLAQEAVDAGKVVAAICVAPITLARAGVLEAKRATTSMPPAAIESFGAIYTGALVEQDGLIITGNGPAASALFGQTIVAALGE
ncbi:MAG: DJ-1/PfpI family protein [Anaerolineales bacterium]|jgi:protease I